DLYVYTDSNNDGVAVDTADNNGIQTFYTIGTHQFLDTDTFVQAKNTNPSGTRDVGNYVKFSKLATYGSGTLGFSQTYVSGGDGLGIAGLQLVEVGGPLPPRLLDFGFNEGQGPVTYDSVNKLPGIFGQALDPAHLSVTTTNSPSGKTNDLAVSFSVGNTN